MPFRHTGMCSFTLVTGLCSKQWAGDSCINCKTQSTLERCSCHENLTVCLDANTSLYFYSNGMSSQDQHPQLQTVQPKRKSTLHLHPLLQNCVYHPMDRRCVHPDLPLLQCLKAGICPCSWYSQQLAQAKEPCLLGVVEIAQKEPSLAIYIKH